MQQIPPHKAHKDLPQLVQLGTVNVTVNKQDSVNDNAQAAQEATANEE